MRRSDVSAKKKDGKDELAAQAVLHLLSGADDGAEELATLVMRQVATLSGDELRVALRGSAKLLKDLGSSAHRKRRRACVTGCNAVLCSLASLSVGEQEGVVRDHVVFLHQALIHVLNAADDHADVRSAARVCGAALRLAATGSIAGDLVMALAYRCTEWLAGTSELHAHAGAAMIHEIAGPLSHLLTPYLFMVAQGLRKAVDIDCLDTAEAVAAAMGSLFPAGPLTPEARRTAEYLLSDIADVVRRHSAAGRVAARGGFLCLAALVRPLKSVWKPELQSRISDCAMKSAASGVKARDVARPAAVRLVGCLAQHGLLVSSSIHELIEALVALVEGADAPIDDRAVPAAFLALAALLETEEGSGLLRSDPASHNTSFAFHTPRSPHASTPRRAASGTALDSLDTLPSDDVRMHRCRTPPPEASRSLGGLLSTGTGSFLDSPPRSVTSRHARPSRPWLALTPRGPRVACDSLCDDSGGLRIGARSRLGRHAAATPHEADAPAHAVADKVVIRRLWTAASNSLISACLPPHLRAAPGQSKRLPTLAMARDPCERQREVAHAAASCIGTLLPFPPPDDVYAAFTAALPNLHLFPALVSILSHLAVLAPANRDAWTQLVFERAKDTLCDHAAPHDVVVETLQSLLDGCLFLQGVDVVGFVEQYVVPKLSSTAVPVRQAAVELCCLLAAATADTPALPAPSLGMLRDAARMLDASSTTPDEQRGVMCQLAAARLYNPPHLRGLHLQVKDCRTHVRQLLEGAGSTDMAARSWNQTLQRVLALAVGDPLGSCRVHAWRILTAHSDRLLKLFAGPCVQPVCLSLSDANEEVQGLALALCVKLCRVSSVVHPQLRSVLLREWNQMHRSRDPLDQARSARVFCTAHHALWRTAPGLVPRELQEDTVAATVVRTLRSSVPIVRSALFDVLSHLLGVAIPMPAATLEELEALAVDAIVDGTSENTKPAAYCLSQVLQRSGRIGMEMVLTHPPLLPRVLELLRAIGERSDVRVAAMRLLGVVGALSPKKMAKVLGQHNNASGTPPWHLQRWWRTITHSQYPSYRVVGALLTILGQPRHRIHHRDALLALQSPLGLLGRVKVHELSRDVVPAIINVAEESFFCEEAWDWVPPFRAALQTLRFVMDMMPTHVDLKLLPALQRVCVHAIEAEDERLVVPALQLVGTLAQKLGPLFRPAGEELLPLITELLTTVKGVDALSAAMDCLKAVTPSFLRPYTRLIAHNLCRCLAVDPHDVKGGGLLLAARCLAAIDTLVVQRLGGQEVIPMLVQTLRRMLDCAQQTFQTPPSSPGSARNGADGVPPMTAGNQLTMTDVWRMCVEVLGNMSRYLGNFAGGSLRNSIFLALEEEIEASALALGISAKEAQRLYKGAGTASALLQDQAKKDPASEETPYRIDNAAVLRATQPSATPVLWLDGLAQTLLGENPRRALKAASSVARIYTPLAYDLLPAAFIAFVAEPRRLEFYQHDAVKKMGAQATHVGMLKTLRKDAVETKNQLLSSLCNILQTHAVKPLPDDVARRVLELVEVYERYEEGVAAVRVDGAPNSHVKSYYVLSPLMLCKTAQSVGLHAKAVHWGEAELLRPTHRDESSTRRARHAAPGEGDALDAHEVDVEACRALVHSCKYLGIDGIEAGVLSLLERRHRKMEGGHHDDARLQENLGKYDKALELYRLAGDTASVIRILTRLGHWDEIVREAGWGGEGHGGEVARCVARAAWMLGDWSQLEAAAERMRDPAAASGDTAGLIDFYLALAATQRQEFQRARDLVTSCRVKLESELTVTLTDAYARSYDTMVSLQQLVELEEIIDFREGAADEPASSAAHLRRLKDVWAARIEHNEADPASLRGTLALRALLLPPLDDVQPWLKFVEACDGPHQQRLARDVLCMLAGVQGGVEPDTPFTPEFLQNSEVALTTLRFLWKEAVLSHSGALSDARYMRTLRKLVGEIQQVADLAKEPRGCSRIMSESLITALEWRRHLKDNDYDSLTAMFEPALATGEALMPTAVPIATPCSAVLHTRTRSRPSFNSYGELQASFGDIGSARGGSTRDSPHRRRHDRSGGRSPRPLASVVDSPLDPPLQETTSRLTLDGREMDAAGHARAVATAKSIWKTWAMLCSTAARERNSARYGIEAMRGFINYVRCCDGAVKSRDQAAVAMVLRLLDLVFLFYHDRDVQAYASANLRTVPAMLWLSVVPQLVARLGGEATAVVRDLLMFVSETCPHSVIYSVLPPCFTDSAVGSAGVEDDVSIRQRRRASYEVLEQIRGRDAQLVEHAELLVTELTQTAVLEAERWAASLEDAYTRSKADPLAVLAPLFVRLRTRTPATDTLDRNRFAQLCGKGLLEAEKLWSDRREAATARGWEAARTVYKEIERLREAMIKRGVHLEAVAPRLAAADGLCLAIPGWKLESPADCDPPLIHSFGHTLSVFQTKTTPRKLRIVDTHGREHDYLLKGHEDLRLDERVMQLLGLVRNLLDQTEGDSDIVGYPVVPLTGDVGLLGWVQGADDLGRIIRSERHPQMALHETNLIRKFARLRGIEEWDTCPVTTRVRALEQVAEATDGDDVHRYLWLQSSSAESWVRRRSAYCRSLASMSMVGFVLGLGDRHVGNILLQKASGRVIHIDFGDCFDIARERARFAERVPFRLTRQLRHATGVGGSKGMFYHTAVSTMTALREGRDLVMSMLEAFVYDPLIQWRLEAPEMAADAPVPAENGEGKQLAAANPAEMGLSHASVKHLMQRPVVGTAPKGRSAVKASNNKAQHVVRRVLHKLTGEDAATQGAGKEVLAQSVSDQVSRLIDEATALNNLAHAFRGWQPWL